MVKVLVTNDDGIDAKGIRALVRALSLIAEVYIFAPAEQQSAKSQSMTSRGSIRVEKRQVKGAEEAFAVFGTPADCVKFGIQYLEEKDIELDHVFSGINMGANISADIHYSGTVGAAVEGALYGIRSVAMSISGYEAEHPEYLLDMLPELIQLSSETDPTTVINVNAPDLPSWKIKGTRFVSTGIGRCFDDTLVQLGEEEYSYKGGYIPAAVSEQDTDHALVHEGYATISPIRTNLTDTNALTRMKRITGAKSLWIFIDYQTKLMSAIRKSNRIIDNAVKAARCADRLGFPILVTQQYTRGLGPSVPELREALPNVERFEKLSFSCFGTTGFEEKMETLEQKNVVLAGVETHICLRQTALDFLERGYNVTVLKDCCGSRKKEDHETALEELANKGCTVTTWETYIYDILGSSTHTAFRTITEIVKS